MPVPTWEDHQVEAAWEVGEGGKMEDVLFFESRQDEEGQQRVVEVLACAPSMEDGLEL